MEIRDVRDDETEEAMALAWQVFSEFEAPEYSDEGVAEFRRYIRPSAIRTLRQNGVLYLLGAYEEAALLGILAYKPTGHISLLFVRTQHHRKGIAKALFATFLARCQKAGVSALDVHASPYAVPVYEKLGFAATAPQRLENGILYVPMRRDL